MDHGRRRGVPLDEVGGGVAGQERLVTQRGGQEVPVGGHPTEVHAFKRQCQASSGLGAGRPVGHHLGQHGVEVDPDHAARRHPGVPTHSRFVGRLPGLQRPGGREEAG